MTVHVTVPLDDEQAARLQAIAIAREATTSEVLAEAVTDFLDYQAWFVREVQKGLASAASGTLSDLDDVERRLKARMSATAFE